jgi:uncharacterized protein (TIGR01777 family)
MKIVVAGGSGFVGRALVEWLAKSGHALVVLTRNPAGMQNLFAPTVQIAEWDGRTSGDWIRHLDGSDGVINLAGEPVSARRWTSIQKKRIMTSRLEATKAIVDAIGGSVKKPQVLINASGVGYYGEVKAGDVAESSPNGHDFFAEICRTWESAAMRAERHGVRVVVLRTGIVLHKSGGVLKRFLLPFNMFVGGPLGPGTQWVSWIHREDAMRAILFALVNRTLSGPANLTAPEPVTMHDFCRELGKAMGRPSWFRVPEFALRLALGEMVDVVIKGQRAVPKKLLDAGFTFRFPNLADAFSDLFS